MYINHIAQYSLKMSVIYSNPEEQIYLHFSTYHTETIKCRKFWISPFETKDQNLRVSNAENYFIGNFKNWINSEMNIEYSDKKLWYMYIYANTWILHQYGLRGVQEHYQLRYINVILFVTLTLNKCISITLFNIPWKWVSYIVTWRINLFKFFHISHRNHYVFIWTPSRMPPENSHPTSLTHIKYPAQNPWLVVPD
jgi:hypothetical protein